MRAHTMPSRRHGFTLLELMVSIAILAAVFGLVGTLWGQAGRWSTDIEHHADGLRLQRILSMMKDQWANRRRGVQLGEKKSDVIANDVLISFTTASPILFPDWPLVVATYRIEPEREVGRTGLWRVVYEETRVASSAMREQDISPNSTVWLPGHDPRGRPIRDRMVLIEGMPWARFERFGRDASADETIPDKVREQERDRSMSDRDSDDTAEDRDALDLGNSTGTDRSKDEPEDEEEDKPGLGDTETQKLAKREMWRPMEEGGYAGVIPAVRLVGEKDKEAFACVFVILASR